MKKILTTLLSIQLLFIIPICAQYNYGVDVCDQDARIEGKINIDDGADCIYIGRNSGLNNSITSNGDNTFLGVESGADLTTGFGNTILGYRSGFNFSSGTSNILLGSLSGYNLSSGGNNVLIGNNAGYNTASNWNNTIIGTSAGTGTGIRGDNVIIGFAAGQNTSGTGNVFIGSEAARNETGSNKLYIENSNSASPLIWGDFSSNDVRINGNLCYTGTIGTCSDINFKRNVKPISNALIKIMKLNGIKHEWKHDEFPSMIWKQGEEFGVIAQEVNELFPELVNEDKDGYLYVDYAKLTPILIEAIKEQQEQISILQEKVNLIDDLSAEIQKIKDSLPNNKKIASN